MSLYISRLVCYVNGNSDTELYSLRIFDDRSESDANFTMSFVQQDTLAR